MTGGPIGGMAGGVAGEQLGNKLGDYVGNQTGLGLKKRGRPSKMGVGMGQKVHKKKVGRDSNSLNLNHARPRGRPRKGAALKAAGYGI